MEPCGIDSQFNRPVVLKICVVVRHPKTHVVGVGLAVIVGGGVGNLVSFSSVLLWSWFFSLSIEVLFAGVVVGDVGVGSKSVLEMSLVVAAGREGGVEAVAAEERSASGQGPERVMVPVRNPRRSAQCD